MHICKSFSNLNGLYDIAKAQINRFQPDILYCQDLSFFSGKNRYVYASKIFVQVRSKKKIVVQKFGGAGDKGKELGSILDSMLDWRPPSKSKEEKEAFFHELPRPAS